MGNKESVDRESAPKIEPLKKKYRKRMGEKPRRSFRKKAIRKKRNNPPSAYALFIRESRNKLFEKKVGFRELTTACARSWREMPDNEKQKYYQMAKEIREEMLRIGGRAQRRGSKDPKSRKKTNYWNFADKYRPVVYNELMVRSGRKPMMKDVNREVGNQWRQLSQQEKDGYKNI